MIKRNVTVTAKPNGGDNVIYESGSVEDAIKHKEMLVGKVGDAEVFMPYGSLITAEVESEVEEVDDPEDDACVTSDGGAVHFFVSWIGQEDATISLISNGTNIELGDGDYGFFASLSEQCDYEGFDTTCERIPITASNFDENVFSAIQSVYATNLIDITDRNVGTTPLTLTANGSSITVNCTVIPNEIH